MPPKKGKTPSLHAKCDPIPTGTVITDIKKNEIVVQKEFAQGGFGRIYDAKVKGSTTKYIVKFEPTDNGPLFNEIHLYPRILTQTALQNYTKEHKLRFLGLPHCVSSGVYKDVRYLVMPKYNYTLEQLISEKKGILSLENTVSVVLSVLDSLEYIHSCDYVHGDIKAGNLMLMSKLDFSKVYLIDFGLAKKINKPVEKDDPKKAHNGTALFTSIDAHRGCGPSFRGDIEILAHNALLWLTGKLPWKKVENTPDNVQKAKSDLMSNISQKVKQLVFDSTAAAFLISLYEASKELKIEQKPNYAAIKKEIAVGAVKRKHGDDGSADIPRLRARKEVKAEKIEEKRKPSQRSFLKSESGTAQELEKLEDGKPKRPYLRKAGSAIAAAKKSNIIYPGLSKQLSLEKNEDIKKLSIETKPPAIKSPTNPRSCRPVLSKTSSAGFSEGNFHQQPSSHRALCNTTPPPRVFPLDGAASPQRPKKKEPLCYRPPSPDSDEYNFGDDSYFSRSASSASKLTTLMPSPALCHSRSPSLMSPNSSGNFIQCLVSTGLPAPKTPVSNDNGAPHAFFDLPLEKILRKRAQRVAESPILSSTSSPKHKRSALRTSPFVTLMKKPTSMSNSRLPPVFLSPTRPQPVISPRRAHLFSPKSSFRPVSFPRNSQNMSIDSGFHYQHRYVCDGTQPPLVSEVMSRKRPIAPSQSSCNVI